VNILQEHKTGTKDNVAFVCELLEVKNYRMPGRLGN